MHTNELMKQRSYTEAAIERLKEYLLTTPESNANIELKSDMLYVKFNNEEGPGAEIIQMARKIFYWADTLAIPHIDGFVHYYSSNNAMLVNLVHYEEISAIYEMLKGFGAELVGFDLNFHEYTFTYDVPGRSNLCYDELMEIEHILEPNENEFPEHLSVFRMGKFYTMTIKHDSWKI